MKEQTRNTGVQINEEERGKLPEKEFRIMIVKMIKNFENKMEKMQESTNKDLEELNNKHTEANISTIAENGFTGSVPNIPTEVQAHQGLGGWARAASCPVRSVWLRVPSRGLSAPHGQTGGTVCPEVGCVLWASAWL